MNKKLWTVVMSLVLLLSFGLMTTGIQAQTGGCSTTHIVQRGETLYRIAVRYNTTVADLQARNSISNPNRISAGQQLCISGGFVPPSTPVPGHQNPPSGSGTVTTWILNVRSGPGTQHAVLQRVRFGEVFQAIGRNANGTWYQIVLNSFTGAKGWVTAEYFNVPNGWNLPVINDVAEPYSANVTLIRDAYLHISPDGNQGIVPEVVYAGMTVRVIGRNAAATWFQITTDNGNRWVRRDVFPADFPQNAFAVTG